MAQKELKNLPEGKGKGVGVNPAGEAIVMPTSQIVFSGWSSAHSTVGNLNGIAVPLDWHEIAPNPEFCSIDGHEITINKAGNYYISGHILQHSNELVGNSNRKVKILKNGVTVYHDHQSPNGSWSTSTPHLGAFFDVGDTLSFMAGVSGGSPYDWHGGGEYAQITVTFLGA